MTSSNQSKKDATDFMMNPLPITEEHQLFLERSFQDFNQATLRLQKAFGHLEQRFDEINRELAAKNAELQKTIAEKEEVKNYLLNILESLTTGVVVADRSGVVATLNRWAETVLGLPQEVVLGKPVSHCLAEVVPLHDDICGGSSGKTRKIRRKERSLEVIGSPMRSMEGEIVGSVLILRDVTRMEKLEEMAKRTDKFAAMGEMAANIAHEIRNPLGSIELFASLLLKDARVEKDRERLLQILTAVKNMDNRISNLLLFTRKPNPLMRPLRLHGVLGDVLEFCGQILEQEGISITARFGEGDPWVDGDPEMLKQVFLNIILNAIQAMPGGGYLEIETDVLDTEEDALAEVRFTDAGTGIAAEDLKRIFDPFFSRKNSTGLGLAIVHNIVDTHRGSIDVESDGNGTVFRIAFPLVEDGRRKTA